MNDRHDIGGKPSLKEIANMIEAVTWKRPATTKPDEIERRVTWGIFCISAFFFVCALISILTLNAVVQKHATVIERFDRLTAIAVLDSARVDSLMVAHDYVWRSREAR